MLGEVLLNQVRGFKQPLQTAGHHHLAQFSMATTDL